MATQKLEQGSVIVDETKTAIGFSRFYTVGPLFSPTDTNGSELSFCVAEKDKHVTYAVIQSQDHNFVLQKHINISRSALVDRITLDTCPIGQYTIFVGATSMNCATARINPELNCNEFNFVEQQSNAFKTYNQLRARTYEGKIPKHETFLYLQDRVEIHYPQDLLSNGPYQITMYGYFDLCSETPNYTSKKVIIYPKSTYSVDLRGPTDSIDILVDKIDPTLPITMNVRFYPIDITCHPLAFGATYGIRIKFRDPLQELPELENDYLSDIINKNTLNMSRLNYTLISFDNGFPIKCMQHAYVVYNYPSRLPLIR
jgi:hypothetical protein